MPEFATAAITQGDASGINPPAKLRRDDFPSGAQSDDAGGILWQLRKRQNFRTTMRVAFNRGLCVAETVAAIVAAHRAGTMTPEQTVARSYRPHPRAQTIPPSSSACARKPTRFAEARALAASGSAADRPLYGVPVAVKDNIDVGGMATTNACPAFTYHPAHDATAVARLRKAGAIVIGKTNLDQFATGLVGVRSPYGTPRNLFDPALIPGGSSSGSGIAVAAGLVPLALGTDTAGSGRVPAGFNNIVGLKPSLGLVSTFGVVPACRTLDCVSVFALTVDDAWTALAAMAGRDENDAYSRDRPLGQVGAMPRASEDRRAAPGRSGCSSATTNMRAAMTRRSHAWRGSAPRSSRSTSSRSTKPRACSTTGLGSPNARSRRARCSRPTRTPFIR